MLNQREIIRGNNSVTENYEITPEGDFQLFFAHADPNPVTLQDEQTTIKQMTIDFDDRGRLVGINTLYRISQLDNAGNPLPGKETLLPHSMNKADVRNFAKNFGPPIRPSMTNGYVRGPLGYNRLPVYDPTGVVIPYTEEELAQEPTRDYDTYNADGTRVDGTIEEPIDEGTTGT